MSTELSAALKMLAEAASLSFEFTAISLLLIFSIASVGIALIDVIKRKRVDEVYVNFKKALTRSVLISLEFLVIADLIATVAVDLTLSSLSALGLLIAIRTFLSLSLEVEIEGAWPWKRGHGGVLDQKAST